MMSKANNDDENGVNYYSNWTSLICGKSKIIDNEVEDYGYVGVWLGVLGWAY